MTRPAVFMTSLLMISMVLISSCGSTVEGPSLASLERRYFDGVRWRHVLIQLNQLAVERRMNTTNDSELAKPTASTNTIMLRQGAASVAALEDVARQMQQAQPDIIAISGYVKFADDHQAPAQRLRNTFALRLQAGLNPGPLLAKHQARQLETVSYNADTYLCEATSTTLFAVLDVVTALQQENGVVFVTPQIEQMRNKR